MIAAWSAEISSRCLDRGDYGRADKWCFSLRDICFNRAEGLHSAIIRDRVCLHQNHCARDVPAVLVDRDLTFNLYCRLAQTDPSDAARGEYLRWLDFERHWLAAYDAVWTMSEEERGGAIREGSDPERTLVVPNGVDVRRFVPGEEGELAPAAFPEVFYVGSFRHLPNILGFQRLCREVMPRVWQRVPNARLRVVAGPRHEYFWSTLAKKGESMDSDPRLEIQGYVEDLRPLYARATMVVAPLEVSAGTNIKVLEAMACGKPVVTTPVGCAGLGLKDEEDAFIREDWEQFAAGVCETLLNAPLRSSVGARARRTVEARFSWVSIAGSAYSSYQALAARWRRPRADPHDRHGPAHCF